MKTGIYLSIIGLIAFSLLFVSCSKDDEGDAIKPVINLLEPEEGAVLKIGDTNGMHFEMDTAGNEAVTSYEINIHNNFDGHSHTRTSEGETTKSFVFERTYADKAGQKQAHVHSHNIKVPAGATLGDYHLMVYCSDQSDNGTHVTRDVVLGTTGDVESEHRRG